MINFYIAASSFFIQAILASAPSPLLGPTYNPPVDLMSPSSAVLKAWQNLTSTLDNLIATNATIEGEFNDLSSYTFSIQMFSLNDANAVQTLQYHHTGPDVSGSANVSNSVQQVDMNSIYRLGSVSKAFSVYLTLIEIGPQYWERSIVDFVPSLISGGTGSNYNTIQNINWTTVTLGALAGQMSGILRGVPPINTDILEEGALPNGLDPITFGFPPLNTSDPEVAPPCLQDYLLNDTYCNSSDLLQSVSTRYPVFPPWTSPSYSNAAYDLLALAVENITGRAFGTMMQTDLFQPLNMSSTHYYPPTNLSHAVIPGGDPHASFALDYEAQIPDGGIYSTSSDMSRFGLSILNSALLQPYITAEWLKPITHTATLQASVGRPWEIFRLQLPSNGRICDLYTKSGDVTNYSAWLVLSPDHQAGFITLGASLQDITQAVSAITDLLFSTVVPALEVQAAAEASSKIAGEYSSLASGLNSSMTIAIDPASGYGISVTSWISNGTDFLHTVLPFLEENELSLFPTGLTVELGNGSSQAAFRSTSGNSTQNTSLNGPASNPANLNWIGLDSIEYGGIGIDLFILTFNASGYATSVLPAALRVTLERVDPN